VTHSTLDLDYLLADFAQRLPHVAHLVAVSADGMLIARTPSLPLEAAERLAAVATGLVSLLAGAAANFNAGQVINNLTEMDGGYLFTMSIDVGASLLVLASRECDIAQVTYHTAELINQVGAALTPHGFTPTTATGGQRW
jgi:predicted regulator of Ras-like GTPase activity (Roadblock/LC7/MglB family)